MTEGLDTRLVRARLRYEQVGILVVLAIGLPVFGAKGGVAFGVATGIVVALGLGLLRGRAEGDPARGGPDGRAAGDGADAAGRG
ncbi:hypothetical protein AB0B74_00090 [Micromonospora parva]|uniref:hypothetical protein n=1 Tax=Micromonospora parva TaxID=1464048 RepID=UPI0033E41C3C